MVQSTAVQTTVDEFKKFAFKGNVVDMAIGVIIGTAFSKVVDSLVKNVMMPLISPLVPNDGGYTQWRIPLGSGHGVPIGLFLGELVNFAIVALALYLFTVKLLGWIMRKKEEAPAAPPEEVRLLTEIRDLMKTKA